MQERVLRVQIKVRVTSMSEMAVFLIRAHTKHVQIVALVNTERIGMGKTKENARIVHVLTVMSHKTVEV